MSNDYTLPPAYAFGFTQSRRLEDYGHACAEAARAPLLARIAELERSFDELAAAVSWTKERCDQDGDSPADVAHRLRAEVEALRAESVIEWEPGRSYTAAELLRRAIRGISGRNGRSICPAVENLFGCGNTVARYLCRWAGREPDTGREIAARKGEGSQS